MGLQESFAKAAKQHLAEVLSPKMADEVAGKVSVACASLVSTLLGLEVGNKASPTPSSSPPEKSEKPKRGGGGRRRGPPSPEIASDPKPTKKSESKASGGDEHEEEGGEEGDGFEEVNLDDDLGDIGSEEELEL